MILLSGEILIPKEGVGEGEQSFCISLESQVLLILPFLLSLISSSLMTSPWILSVHPGE